MPSKNLPCPNDYGEELEQQSARKAAKEYEWSGRHEEDYQLLASVIVATITSHLAYGANSKELEATVRKILTTRRPGV